MFPKPGQPRPLYLPAPSPSCFQKTKNKQTKNPLLATEPQNQGTEPWRKLFPTQMVGQLSVPRGSPLGSHSSLVLRCSSPWHRQWNFVQNFLAMNFSCLFLPFSLDYRKCWCASRASFVLMKKKSSRIFKSLICVCLYTFIYIHRSQRHWVSPAIRVSRHCDTVSHLTWMLETELRSSARVCVLKHHLSSPCLFNLYEQTLVCMRRLDLCFSF